MKVCPICNKKFNEKRREQKTCSITCGHKLQGKKISGQQNYKYNNEIPIKKCKQCGKEFRPDSMCTVRRKGRAQFCSKKCHNESMIKKKIKFVCLGCGVVFYRRPGRAVSDPNIYCSKKCYLKYGTKHSYKVIYMINWLNAMGYKTEQEKTFNWLRNPKTNHNLFIDIFLPDYNIAIEYDGKQHFEPCMGYDTEKDVLYRQELDAIKNDLCDKNGINMIRFKYDDEFTYENFVNTLKHMV